MSIKSKEGNSFTQPIRGKRRREVIPPQELPELDADGLTKLIEWKEKHYKQPILDSLLGYYRFNPATKAGAEAYTRSKRKATRYAPLPPEVILDYIKSPSLVDDPQKRQIIHTAESLELATALFWSVAILRSTALEDALSAVNQQKTIDPDAAVYAADAIVDYGLCLESPYENNYRLRHLIGNPNGRKTPQGLKERLDKIAPHIGTNLVDFGAYAGSYPDALVSSDGVYAMQVVYDEQFERVITWSPRHHAVTEAYPDLPISREVLNLGMSLSEMLRLQDDFFLGQAA